MEIKKVEYAPEVMRHFEFENPFNDEGTCYINRIMVEVANLLDQALVQAVLSYAQREGLTDLYLIDAEFVKTALLNEANRRKGLE